ncbi:M20/M25/M40 family metallo-hydrolase [Aeromicrobium ginsengisoli]|uniref:M20/M25/M40 family metallo-hydrolase n=1 Tax=Aeromicrobium ginsengisoli TaxID=363867 RepID=A0A5M4FD97_9ACTN|nr:M20/M25/M40 family metallo-hydrolase [Aeromicrobium ginsengisoli]KAA1395872.1 M20/M25/M40 family metallo-hydrolase [Aeromicrobium ginsengisoli]
MAERPDVVSLLQTLLRFDTTNRAPGDAEGELAAAMWIHDLLVGAGLEPVLLAREDAPDRANVVVRVPGTDPSLEGLLVHAHLDVVPAEPEQWSFDPFGGDLVDGYVTGRGAMDMKDMAAMTLAVLLDWASSGERPRRDVVVAFVADEETDGAYGAQWLVEAHPELFAGVAAGIGESGGVVESHVGAGGPVRLARIAAGERGTLHLKLTATGSSGHASRPTEGSAVLALVDALHRIGHHDWPLHMSPLVRAQLEQTAAALGVDADLDDDDGVLRTIDALGDAADVALFTVRASTTPTVVRAGYKVNVIPGLAEAEIDVRCPPGFEDELLAALPELVGDGVTFEHSVREPSVQAPIDGPWFDAMVASIQHVDPSAVVVPGCLGGGTDAKAFSLLGIACYGFVPATADPEGRRRSGLHGVDERVPVSSLCGGLEILAHFLATV